MTFQKTPLTLSIKNNLTPGLLEMKSQFSRCLQYVRILDVRPTGCQLSQNSNVRAMVVGLE